MSSLSLSLSLSTKLNSYLILKIPFQQVEYSRIFPKDASFFLPKKYSSKKNIFLKILLK
jgi:hypothetical protein